MTFLSGNRILIVKCIKAFCFSMAFFAIESLSAERLEGGGPPNIVLIVADDLGYGDVGYHGSSQIKTPHIDALSMSGVSLSQGYVSAPVCAPSRAGLITGRNQVEFGFDNNLTHDTLGFDPQYAGIDVNQQTIATRLKGVGYRTGIVGKWHLGHLSQFHPLNRGFDEFWGFTGGGHNYFPTVESWEDEPKIENNLNKKSRISYLTDDIGTESIEFIERNKRRPFFLYAAFNAPHSPMQATKEDLELYSFVKDEKRRTYCAMVHRLDVNIGRIRTAISDAGVSDNTLVVFLSDNGGPVDQNCSLNAPLNGQKGILLEGGVRVPFVLSWPGVLPSGRVYEDPVSSLDLAPTFWMAANQKSLQPGAFDGKNIIPYLKSDKADHPHRELMWRFTVSGGIRKGHWKLIRLPDRLPMLFNLKDDPKELRNVALENLEVTNELLSRLGKWDMSLPHPRFLEGAVWRQRQLNLYDSLYPLTQPKPEETPKMISFGRTN